MTVVVTSPITHLCPFRDEIDHGTVEFTFNGKAPELHRLAAVLGDYANEAISHESLTAQLGLFYPEAASIVTHWITAGCQVEVRA